MPGSLLCRLTTMTRKPLASRSAICNSRTNRGGQVRSFHRSRVTIHHFAKFGRLHRSQIAISYRERLLCFCRASQVEPRCGWSEGVLAAGLSFGSLKYKHHFGLDCFSIRGEHWALHASLTHSISDDSFAASGLDASAFAVRDLGRTGFVGGKFRSVGAARSTTFSRSRFPLSAHPATPRARSVANTHFIFFLLSCSVRHIRCIMRSLQAIKDES